MCTYCGVDGHTRDECPDRQEREIGTERQLDGDLKSCPECGRTVNTDVNKRCWGADCEHEFDEREIRTDGGEYREPSGWEQHPRMSKSSGYLDAFRTPDHTAFVDIIEYKPHMEPDYVVEYLEQSGGPESFRTDCKERIDCADEAEAWEAATDLMERHAGDDKKLVTDGGTATTGSEQARLDVGDTRKPIVLKNARRVTTGDLSTLAMCAHRFEPADVMGWYTHEYDDVLREWICSNVGSVIARLSPHCEDTRGDLSPLHPSDDLWTGSVSDSPTQATLEDTEADQ